MSWTKWLVCLIIAQYDVQIKHLFLGKNPIPSPFLARVGVEFFAFQPLHLGGGHMACVRPRADHAR